MFFDDQFVRLRLERGAQHLHSLWPACGGGIFRRDRHTRRLRQAIDSLPADYCRWQTRAMIEAAGADRFPPSALREVR